MRIVELMGPFRKMISSQTFSLCLAGVLLPNAPSILSLLAGIGTPPRTSAIAAYATLAFIARLVPPFVTLLLLVAVVFNDGATTLALVFNLAPQEIATALHLATELRLFSSPLYLMMIFGAAVALAATAVALISLRKQRGNEQRGNASVLAGAALAFLAIDSIANTSPHYHFGRLYAAGKPMETAAESSGFRATVINEHPQHVLLVIVEALGQFADPEHRALLLRPFQDPGLNKRYTVTTGETTYYGSTTAAEMRELCHTREPYEVLLAGRDLDCLPEQMLARHYQTTAIHGFTSRFFDRGQWYPSIGFEKSVFGENFAGILKRVCGSAFRGICDADIIPTIRQGLQQATKPTFTYWLTLNTHVPIAQHEAPPLLDCESGSAIKHVEVCHMTEMWLDLLQGIAALTADIPPTEILIVGDHAPPLWSKAGRNLFVPGKVPWIRLKPISPVQASGG